MRDDNDADILAETAEQEIATWEEEGMRFVSVLDADYPAQLLTVHQRPPFLMTRGVPSSADARGVAVVGTRKATDRGMRQEQWAYELSSYKSAACGIRRASARREAKP